MLGLALLQEPVSPTLPVALSRTYEDLLYVAGLRAADVRSENPPALAFSPILSAHEDPFQVLQFAERLSTPSNNALSDVRKVVFGEENLPAAPSAASAGEPPADLPDAIRQLVRRLVNSVEQANDEVRQALIRLDSNERRDLLEGLPRLAMPPHLEKLDFATRPMPSWGRLIELVKKVDLGRIRHAAERLYGQVEATLPDAYAASSHTFTGKRKFSMGGVAVVLGTTGDDLHDDRDAQLTIDFGGNDRYTGRHGAGIGYAAVHLDLGGDDTYDTPDISLGAGLLGIGLSWDLGGRDIIRGRSLTMGCGIAGVGVFRAAGFVRGSGLRSDDSDLYRTVGMSQGFGMFGVGICRKNGGDDDYRAKWLSQGAALEEGVGWLIDDGGDDFYVLPGLGPSFASERYFNARGQGFGGFSMRDAPARRGLGLLLDRSGSDDYHAGAEAIGRGTDGGLGAVIDLEGDDRYDAAGDSLASASAGGVGLLWDRSGEDLYLGAASLSIASGSDSGIAMLLDEHGRDTYIGSGASIAPSVSGVSLLLDGAGGDRYVGTSSLLPASPPSFGFRVDLGGPNETAAEEHAFLGVSPAWSGVAQRESRPETLGSSEIEPLPSSRSPATSIQDVERLLAVAVGDIPGLGRRQRLQAAADLKAGSGLLLNWLDSRERPVTRLEALSLAPMLPGSTSLIERFKAPQALQANNALRLAAAMPAPPPGVALAPVQTALQRAETAASAADLAARWKLKECASDLMVGCASPDQKTRRAAARALAEMDSRESFATALVLLSSPDPVVRFFASEMLALPDGSGFDFAKQALDRRDELSLRAAIAALGRIGTPAALSLIGGRLSDQVPGVRISALFALAGRCPREFRAKFNACREDADLRVRQVASVLDPGR